MQDAAGGALYAGFVAAEDGEAVGAPAEDAGQFLGLAEAIVLLLEVILAVEDAGLEEAAFEATDRLEVVEEGGAEFVESLFVFE
jgi:hypothetical protein